MRTGLVATLGIAASLACLTPVLAQAPKTSVVLGMPLEPPGLDPTTGAASAIAEIGHYNIFEGLTKIEADNAIAPLLAESWTISPDLKTWTFRLRQGVKFQDGEPLSSEEVKFSFTRNAASDSTNKDKAFFANFASIETPDPQTVVINLKAPNPDMLFHLGLSSDVIVDRKSAATLNTNPVGTGPYRLENWARGSGATLVKWPGFRDAGRIAIEKVTFRFIAEPAAQVAALLAGDVDAFPRFSSYQSVARFRSDPRFTVTTGGTEGKTILSMNNARKPLDDVRVRRAIAHAIDRKAIIDGAMDGFGAPIGSHYVPIDPGYIDLTGQSAYDPGKAKALLAEAGVKTPLDLTLTLPPPAYARQGGEIIAAMLAEVGIRAKIENVEWAQWLSGAFKGNFDLTIIAHVEPMDIAIYADPNYYFHYDSPAYRELLVKLSQAGDQKQRLEVLGAIQRRLADDAVNAFLFQLPQVNVADKRLKGLWKDSPLFANDVGALRWE